MLRSRIRAAALLTVADARIVMTGRREASATIAEPETTELATAVGRQLTAKIFPLLLIGGMIHTARTERPHD
jgi:hypothetical protein